MIFPISTDAPIYYWPWMTLVLIGANAITFLVTGFGHDCDGWILTYGQGLRPLEWLAYSFFHVNGMHLLSNAFFLWGFGIVVEGKLGWWKFLLLYLGIAVIGGAVIQGVMLNHKPRELPRLQLPNPHAVPTDAPPTNSPAQIPAPTTPAASVSEQPPLGTNPAFPPNQNRVPPQFSEPMNDDEDDFTPGDTKQRKRNDEFGEHERDKSVTDILWGNEHVFMKPGIKGASLMVYALLAITLVWAPRNEITCFVLKIPPGTFEAQYLYFCGFRVVIQVLYAMLTDFRPTEEFGHFFGVVSGFGVGTLLLKRGWVDCENWDLFAVMSGTHGNRVKVGGWQERDLAAIVTPLDAETSPKKSKKKKSAFRPSIYASDGKPKKSPRSKALSPEDEVTESSEEDDPVFDNWQGFNDEAELDTLDRDDSAVAASLPQAKSKPLATAEPPPPTPPVDPATFAIHQIRDSLKAGQTEVALHLYRGHKASNPNWDLEETDLVALGDALHKAQRWDDAAPLMEACLQRFPATSLRTRVKLAGIYVEVQRRPRAAIKLLQGVSRKTVPEKLQAHYDAISTLARQLIDMSIEDRSPPA